MNNQGKNILIWISIFIALIGIFQYIFGEGLSSKENIAFSEFVSKVEKKEVETIKIRGAIIEGVLNNGKNFTTYSIITNDLMKTLYESGVYIEILPFNTKMGSFIEFIISSFPTLLIFGVWIFLMRQMNGGGGRAMGFGRSKAKLMSDKGPKITFDDVAGIDEAKEQLVEIVDFLRDPGKFRNLGGKIPKGCLLIGPPGTGKTLLAKSIAGEANVPFFSISGSDFVEMFVGVGASRVRDMFDQGKKNAPCIIFIDEIDAVGRHRGIGLGGGNDEREQTLNQILVEMDGFESSEGVIIIAATNRPDVLDPALLRPGRFDRQITVSNPDIEGRKKILDVHLKKVKTDSKLDSKIIARGTPGFSGADLANLVNEGALIAARKNKKHVTLEDLEYAKDKALMGVERRSMVLTDEQKKLTAYHESGHALVGLYSKASDPIHKATIIPRGRALGLVMTLPEQDKVSITFEKMESDIALAMGGRVAEEIIFGKDKVTSGASSDLEQATRLARAMVMEWGLSKDVGPVYHGSRNDDQYSGTGQNPSRSEFTSELIDKEVKKILDAGYKFATKILEEHINQLHILATALIEHETLTGKQISNILAGHELNFKGEVTTQDMKDNNKVKKIK